MDPIGVEDEDDNDINSVDSADVNYEYDDDGDDRDNSLSADPLNSMMPGHRTAFDFPALRYQAQL